MHARSSLICLQSFRSVFVIVLFSLHATTALAAAKDDYNQAVEFFKKGDYHSAITKFKSAEKQGMASANLYYNLGSAYYKIEQYEASKKYFTRVTEYPDRRALAEFNLGMIAVKQKDKKTALKHFEYAAANSDDKKIVDLSKLKIAGLQAGTKRWGAYINANIGYDDNISVTPDNLALGVDDTFYIIYAIADLLVHGERKNGWLLDASVFTIDFTDTDDFDQDFYTLGVRNERRLASWDTLAHLRYGNSTFGGDDLQSFYKLDFLGARPLSGNSKIILQYRFDDFTSKNPVYDYLEGWRQRAQIRYFRNAEKSNQQRYYEGELNNRGELVTSSVSYEYSPTRHTLGGKYTQKFSDTWYLTGDVSYRTSDFPASATLDRDDTRWLFDVLLEYRFSRTLQLRGDVKYIQNDSTVDIYTYDRTVISLGLSKLF